VSNSGRTEEPRENAANHNSATYNASVKESAAKAMDIRQLREEKPKLGWLADVRFNILHNHRKLDELEFPVSAHLKATGPLRVVTRQNLFEFALDGEKVNLVIREGRKLDGLAFQAVPEAVQLFCNEAITLHKNQHLFWHLTEDEVRQVVAEFQELAGAGGILVKKGRHALLVQIKDGRLDLNACDSLLPAPSAVL